MKALKRPATVIALLALFVALGGTTYAATHLPENSVGTKQLRKNAVTALKIKNGGVTAAKVNAKGLIVPDALHAASADLATTAVNATHATSAASATSATYSTSATTATSAIHATNATHAISVDSATNATHATSVDSATNATHATSVDSAVTATTAITAGTARALSGAQIVAGPTESLAGNSQGHEIVRCPAGMVAIAGTAWDTKPYLDISLNAVFIDSANGGTNNEIEVYMNNATPLSANWNADAICIHGDESGSAG